MASHDMFGRCACGGSLTVDHLQNHCPLRKRADPFMSVEGLELMQLITQAAVKRAQHRAGCFDITHVAILGEN